MVRPTTPNVLAQEAAPLVPGEGDVMARLLGGNEQQQPSNALARLSVAERALAEAKTLNEIKQIRDLAAAAEAYTKAAKLGIRAQNHAGEIKLRAERKAGELLAQLERDDLSNGGDAKSAFHIEKPISEYRAVLTENEVPPVTAWRWQRLAELPEEKFEEFIAEKEEIDDAITSAALFRFTQEYKRQQMVEQKRNQPWPNGRYRVIYADPPWQYGNQGLDEYGHAKRHYPTMGLTELCNLDVQALCDDNAVLFLWVTSPLLRDAFRVIDAWGFQYKTSFVWDKVRHNFGYYNSVRHELLLICTRGSCTPDERQLFDSVQTIERTETHSEKPEQFRTIIDTLYPIGRRIELFARRTVENWEQWSNEPTIEFS